MEFNEEESILIKRAHKSENIWGGEYLKPVRDKIKSFILNDNSRCCYCWRSFRGEFKMVIDVEHILPSSIFRDYCFDHRNLSLACKRCNMQIKNDKIDFLDGGLKIVGSNLKDKKKLDRYISKLLGGINIYFMPSLVFNSEYYKIIHPKLDVYTDNIKKISFSSGENEIVVYKCLTDKGRYTFDYFKLSDLEVKNLDASQNLVEIFNESLILINDII